MGQHAKQRVAVSLRPAALTLHHHHATVAAELHPAKANPAETENKGTLQIHRPLRPLARLVCDHPPPLVRAGFLPLLKVWLGVTVPLLFLRISLPFIGAPGTHFEPDGVILSLAIRKAGSLPKALAA